MGFVRRSSGLVRTLTPVDTFFFNFIAAIPLTWVFYLYPFQPNAFPGADIPVACLLVFLLGTPVILAYAMMSTVMPRSGGDYIFQSRVLGGGIGFVVLIAGAVTWWTIYLGVLPSFVSSSISTMAVALTILGHNQGLLHAASWLGSTGAQLIIGISLVIVINALLATGLRTWMHLQRLLFSVIAGTILIMLSTLVVSSPLDFQSSVNQLGLIVVGKPDFYQSVIKEARIGGYQLNPPFSLSATLLFVPLIWNGAMYTVFSNYVLGEMKNAHSLKMQLVSMYFSYGLVLLVIASMFSLFQKLSGVEFFNAWAYLYSYNGPSYQEIPIPPYLTSFVIFLNANPLASVIIVAGFLLNTLASYALTIAAATRIMFAAAFDGLLPSKLAYVSPRFQAPTIMHLVYGGLTAVWVAVFVLIPVYEIMYAVAVPSMAIFAFSTLSMTLLPYRRGRIFEVSPAAKIRIKSIPLLSILGGLGFVFCVYSLLTLVFLPAYGMLAPLSMSLVLGFYAAWTAWYVVFSRYQRGKGVDLALVYREIPPE